MNSFAHNPAAWLLLAAILVPSLMGLKARPELIERGVFRPARWPHAEPWWTPISSAFVHADLGHLLFNAITFWSFAFPLERTMGTLRFVLLYFAGLLGASAVSWLRQRHNPRYATLGASGAILAVLFAFILYQPGASLYVFLIPVPVPAALFALLYVAYSIWASRVQHGRVNHDAHLAGAAVGVAFVALTDAPVLARALGHWLG